MAEVKWIKITTDIFDDEKILLIESLPDSYAIITVWFKLLCLAGKQNNSGVFMMGRIPYTDKMLATIFRMKEATVAMALQTFREFGMIEIIDGVITIPNWGKHQNLDQLESKKEYMRGYMKKYREKQQALTSGKTNCKTNSKANVSQADIEEDKEKEIEVEVDVEVEPTAATAAEVCVENSVENSPKVSPDDMLLPLGGTLGKGVVYLSNNQMEDLLNRIGIDGFNLYSTRLADFIIKNNAHVKNHYETILKWYEEDSKVGGEKA